ncbi:endonuclease/exonuclease/phosphatase family protein [Nocardioides sp.]|uniref:endonuclease/exonuclease/phosphatase family protein n=1 Tax=Nocardioides sp. TaxID=35761 RepID=UPI00286AA5CF|nr:endonuclease/exonuclease/phosphatase family protein [Nocardioides sp.]
MPRRPAATRACLLAATLITGAAVGAGVLRAPGPVDVMVVEAASRSVVSGADVNARPATVSRGGERAGDLAPAAQTSERTSDKARRDRPDAGSLVRIPRFKVARTTEPIEKLPPGPVPGDPFSFRIGTLNILGSQHKSGGTSRASALAGAIQGRGVDIVGLQEVQDDQLAVLQNQLSGYTVWPGQSLGNQGVRLQIAWRDSLFSLVDTGSITTTFDHQQRPIPWVLLEDRATQGQFYVIDVHNSPRDQEGDRDSATGEEIALINELRSTGKPVFIVGDMNEHTEFFCRVAASTGMVGSNGAYYSGGCNTGAGPIKIDWILGSGGEVDFSGHVVDYGDPIRYATDHAFVHADVQVTPLISQG